MKVYKETEQYGLVAAIIGSIGMVTWLIPLLGIVISMVAIKAGFYSVDNKGNGFAIAGIVLGILGLLLSIIRSGLVYYYG